jgi:hypothetical protein
LTVEREKPMQEVLPLLCIACKIVTELLSSSLATEKWHNPIHDSLEPLCDRISIGVRVLTRSIGIENLGHEAHRIEGESESHMGFIVLKIIFVAVGADEMLNGNNMFIASIAPAPLWLHFQKMGNPLKDSENDTRNCEPPQIFTVLAQDPSSTSRVTDLPPRRAAIRVSSIEEFIERHP